MNNQKALDKDIIEDLTTIIRECVNIDAKERPDVMNLLSRAFFKEGTISFEIQKNNALEHNKRLGENHHFNNFIILK